MAFLDDLKTITQRVQNGEMEGFTMEDIQVIAPILAYHTQLPQMLMDSPTSLLGGGRDTSAAQKFMADVEKITGSRTPQGNMSDREIPMGQATDEEMMIMRNSNLGLGGR